MSSRNRRSTSLAIGFLAVAACILTSCQFESEWKTAPKFYLVNDTGVTVNVYYVDDSRGLVRQEPPEGKMALSLNKENTPGTRSPDLKEDVDFDDDGCIDVSIVAFEVDFHDPGRDGRLVDRIPAGTCWEPGSNRTFTLESD